MTLSLITDVTPKVFCSVIVCSDNVLVRVFRVVVAPEAISETLLLATTKMDC